MQKVQELKEIVSQLRGPGGCPWDRAQDHKSVCDCLVEEVSEVLDAIDRDDVDNLKEELGDLLLQVVFHSQMAAEANRFTLEDVAEGICKKLVRRHPHVFGDAQVENIDQLFVQWEKLKAEERKEGAKEEGLFKDLPPKLPALLFAKSVYKQILKKKLDEEGDFIRSENIQSISSDLTEEIAGERLFEIVGACKESGIDPESALRRYADSLTLKIEQKSKTASLK